MLLLADWQVLGELEVLVEHPAFLFVGMLVLVARVAAVLGLLGQALLVAVAQIIVVEVSIDDPVVQAMDADLGTRRHSYHVCLSLNTIG